MARDRAYLRDREAVAFRGRLRLYRLADTGDEAERLARVERKPEGLRAYYKHIGQPHRAEARDHDRYNSSVEVEVTDGTR